MCMCVCVRFVYVHACEWHRTSRPANVPTFDKLLNWGEGEQLNRTRAGQQQKKSDRKAKSVFLALHVEQRTRK